MLSTAGCFKPCWCFFWHPAESRPIFYVPRKYHVLRNDGIYIWIYIYAAWNSVLSLQHTATRALESKLLETKEILGICFPEILRRKQEIWDLGTGAISTRKVHWRVLGGNWWTIHTFLTLGCHGREDQGRSSRFIFVIWRYLGILGFAAVSTRIHNHHTRRLAHQWAFWASGQPRVKKTPQYHPEFVDVSPLFVVRKPSYA